ncbi:MAG: ATP-binding protein [Thermodesulfovibrio sp.]|nr:ATP-binding protein [Thermodesulfovibrio sp.]
MSLIISGHLLYKNANEATEEALKMQALGITVTLDSFIQNLSIKKIQIDGSNIMSEMLLDDRWEGIAFLALYDEKGKVILHSNPALIGKIFDEIKSLRDKKSPFYHRVMLGTGEKVFVSDTRIKIANDQYILRVALHTYPAETLLRTAKTHLIFMGFSVLLIIFSGIFAILIIGKIEKMQTKMRELENLSMLAKVLAHEIRNPLGSIKGFSQYLINKISEPQLKEYLDIILKESLRLERLSDELSHYANPHSMNITDFNLQELFHEIILSFIGKTDINFKSDVEGIFIKTDRDKLKQILTNIIQNAVDAMTEVEEKRITVIVKKINGKIKIEITDTGIGMDEDTLRRATEAFFTTKPKGTGLGLAIVSKLCESLKIEFKIMSKKGEGTTVWLIIPESL